MTIKQKRERERRSLHRHPHSLLAARKQAKQRRGRRGPDPVFCSAAASKEGVCCHQAKEEAARGAPLHPFSSACKKLAKRTRSLRPLCNKNEKRVRGRFPGYPPSPHKQGPLGANSSCTHSPALTADSPHSPCTHTSMEKERERGPERVPLAVFCSIERRGERAPIAGQAHCPIVHKAKIANQLAALLS